jgi:hypothetical protein
VPLKDLSALALAGMSATVETLETEGKRQDPSNPEGGSGSGLKDPVEEMMKNMKLTDAEADRLVDDDEDDQGLQIWALAGKILAPEPKVFHINTISSALRPAWGNPKGLLFKDSGPNLFIAELSLERDREKI